MAQQKIYLRKVRDFGLVIGDTFQFMRQEFKPLMSAFLLISGVFILAAAVAGGFLQMNMTSLFGDVTRNEFGSELFSVFIGRYFLVILTMMVAMAAMQTAVAVYQKLYDKDTDTSPAMDVIWNEFKRYFPKILLLAFVKLIIYTIGLVLCILPGIYFIVVLTPMTWIIVNEDASIGEAFSKCFRLVRENFWISLGVYFVAYLIYSVAASVIGVVFGIVVGIASYLGTKEFDSTMAIVTSVTNVFTYMFYVIFAVSVGLHYYSLTEQQDGTGMMRRLSSIGNTGSTEAAEETY